MRAKDMKVGQMVRRRSRYYSQGPMTITEVRVLPATNWRTTRTQAALDHGGFWYDARDLDLWSPEQEAEAELERAAERARRKEAAEAAALAEARKEMAAATFEALTGIAILDRFRPLLLTVDEVEKLNEIARYSSVALGGES